MAQHIAQDEWGLSVAITEEYTAPCLNCETRTLHLAQRTPTEAEMGMQGAAGTWSYEWHWRAEGHGYATMAEARAAALAQAADWWPGLVRDGR